MIGGSGGDSGDGLGGCGSGGDSGDGLGGCGSGGLLVMVLVMLVYVVVVD